jgi:hypothetical protein
MNYFDEIRLKDEIISLRQQLKCAQDQLDASANIRERFKEVVAENKKFKRIIKGNTSNESERLLNAYLSALRDNPTLAWRYGADKIKSRLKESTRLSLWYKAVKLMNKAVR